MSYSHLLVPPSAAVVFEPATMVAFLEAAAVGGYIGENAERFVLTNPDPSGAFTFTMTRDMPQKGTFRGRRPASWVRPASGQELQIELEKGGNQQATIWSERRPSRAPLVALEALQRGTRKDMAAKEFDELYLVAITCHRMEGPVSMSDDGHYRDADLMFGDPIDPDEVPTHAVANYPHKEGDITVEGIGAARSWVSITFGNYVFPPNHLFEEPFSPERGLAFVVPDLLALATKHFGELRQTCAWG